jgi:glycosyltransferase involved in cell wall biosynthesis
MPQSGSAKNEFSLPSSKVSPTNAQPFLEIAIPTHNRAAILYSTLKEITAALDILEDDVLLRVIDNCSTDHTFQVVQPYLNTNKLSYEKNSTNIGATKNIAKCINSSIARWVWVFGDDDHIILHSLPFLLKTLKSLSNDIVFARALCLKVTDKGLIVEVEKLANISSTPVIEYDPGVAIAWHGSIHSLAFISTLIINPLHWDQDYHDSIYDDNDLYTFVLTLLHACIRKKSADLNLHIAVATDRGDRSYYTPKMCVSRLTEYTLYEQIVHDVFGKLYARRILCRGRKNMLTLRLLSSVKLVGNNNAYKINRLNPIPFMASYRSPYLRDVVLIRSIAILGRLPFMQKVYKSIYDYFYARFA